MSECVRSTSCSITSLSLEGAIEVIINGSYIHLNNKDYDVYLLGENGINSILIGKGDDAIRVDLNTVCIDRKVICPPY